jgi:hypothetical protein
MSKNNKTLLLVGAVIAVILLYLAFRKSETRKESGKSSPAVSSGNAPSDFHGIPPEGSGGDPDLNRMKNRWSAPATYTPMSIAEIIAMPHDALDAMDKEHRSRWSSGAQRQASASESKGVQVTGYIARVKEEGAESSNGKSEIYHDFHIWLTDAPGMDKSTGIIVEAIPFWKEQYPAWQLTEFEKLAYDHTKVRVSGWILWDEEHDDEVGKSRGSSWEIHPITKFEVFSEGGWQNLITAP